MPEEHQWSPGFVALRRLLLDFLSSDASEIDLQQGDVRLRARKGVRRPVFAATALDAPVEAAGISSTGVYAVSPLTGVAYLSSSPQAAPYVTVGDHVEIGQVIAMVESMKVFNEVKSEHAGRVVRILVSSGDIVQKGQPILELA